MRYGGYFNWALVAFLCGCSSSPSSTSQTGGEAVTQLQADPSCCVASGTQVAMAGGGSASLLCAHQVRRSGGNLVDATVAAAFCLAVEKPHHAGIGGGGFMTLRWEGENHFVDFREVAPRATRARMFERPESSREGALSVAVPGFVAGMTEAHARWGKLPWAEVLKPAIHLAEQGFEVSSSLAEKLKVLESRKKDPTIADVFFHEGMPLRAGQRLVQPDLAQTLELVAENGAKGFYQGVVGRKLVSYIKREGGVLQARDLRTYKARFRKPLSFKFAEYDVLTAPPPSAGGVALAQILRMGGDDPVSVMTPGYAHRLAESFRRAYAQRAQYLGDPDHVRIPLNRLVSESTAQSLFSNFDPAAATPSEDIAPTAQAAEKAGTTGFVVMDAQGNAISLTATINTAFGSKLMVPGTGVILNNQMDDFDTRKGPDAYGLISGAANRVGAGRRPVSSMMPTLVLQADKPVLALTGAGGPRIITSMAQVVLNYLRHRPGDLAGAVLSPRLHHQWFPDKLDLEKGFGESLRAELNSLGHAIAEPEWVARVEAVARARDGVLTAVYDPRDQSGVLAE